MLVITGGYGFSIVGFINQLTTGSGYSNPILLVCLVLSHLCPTYPMYEPDWILLAIELSLHLIATRPNRPICSQKKIVRVFVGHRGVSKNRGTLDHSSH